MIHGGENEHYPECWHEQIMPRGADVLEVVYAHVRDRHRTDPQPRYETLGSICRHGMTKGAVKRERGGAVKVRRKEYFLKKKNVKR